MLSLTKTRFLSVRLISSSDVAFLSSWFESRAFRRFLPYASPSFSSWSFWPLFNASFTYLYYAWTFWSWIEAWSLAYPWFSRWGMVLSFKFLSKLTWNVSRLSRDWRWSVLDIPSFVASEYCWRSVVRPRPFEFRPMLYSSLFLDAEGWPPTWDVAGSALPPDPWPFVLPNS